MIIVGICGSLRKGSHNRKLFRQILKSLQAKGAQVEEVVWEDFPNYNKDVEDVGLPESVVAFKAKIEAADALVFTTPEYNYSLPGGFKNALDWASRPDSDIPKIFGGKVVLASGASEGARGTARAQMHLANVCQDLKLIISPSQILLSNADEAFDKDGNLINENDIKQLQKATETFVELVGKVRR